MLQVADVFTPRTGRFPIPTLTESDVVSIYTERAAMYDAQRQAVQRRWNLIANVRLLGFVLLALTLWWALRGPHGGKWALAAVLVIGVVVLIAHHGRLRRQRDRLAGLVQVNLDAINRLQLDWATVPTPDGEPIPRSHAYAWDLNVTGPGSILARISTPTLRHGWATLTRWFLQPATPDMVTARQEAVRELADQLDLRQGVEVAGRQSGNQTPDPEPFLAWAEEDSWLLDRPWLWLLAIISPVCVVVLAGFGLAGMLSWPLWLIPITVNVVVFQLIGKRTAAEVARAIPVQSAVVGYAETFRTIGESSARAQRLVAVTDTLGLGAEGATNRMSAFSRITSFVIPRASIIWSPVQMALLWDVHVLHALERWRRSTGGSTRSWFAAAGEWEALAALSVLAHDHGSWCFPVVETDAAAITATAMAHPLIRFDEAVANDVEVGPEGTFLFVTGSNMSGKSTLLRAVGLNAVLGMAGGPVSARAFRMPVVDVWTCMRVEDSLAHGVSFFMAELQRLKSVVDAADSARERPVLYLLDEILQGTNTAERQIASRRVLGQLTQRHAIGGVSSHDLTLIEGSALEGAAVSVHFAETFTREGGVPNMTFDYRLRPGLATSTNALALMEMLGFDVRE